MFARLLGSILLISGTTIGAGMLALPLATGLGGFFPATILLIVAWWIMLISSLYILEVNLCFKEEVNIITMTKKTLGKWGSVVAWITYLFLLYCLITAYISGTGGFLKNVLEIDFNINLNEKVCITFFAFLFGYIIYLGTKPVDYINRFLMIGLVITYFVLVFFTTPHVEIKNFIYSNPKALWFSCAIAVMAFGYHIIIPSLITYLDHNVKLLKIAIFVGSSIPLIVYFIWQTMLIGVVSVFGEWGFQSILADPHPEMALTIGLEHLLGNKWIALGFGFFSFFAITTSIMGVSLSLSDFLADGFNIKKTSMGRFCLILLTFIPPVIFAFFNENVFIKALSFAGAYGVAILLIILPSLMVWANRYHKKWTDKKYVVFGGKLLVVIIFLCGLIIISLQVLSNFESVKNWFLS